MARTRKKPKPAPQAGSKEDPRSDEWSRSLGLVLGKVIEQLRKQPRRGYPKGMNQGELAEAAGLHPTALSKIERGVTSPSVTTLYRLAEALDVPPDEILAQCREVEKTMGKMAHKQVTKEFTRSATSSINWLGLLGSGAVVAGIAAAAAAALFAAKRGVGDES